MLALAKPASKIDFRTCADLAQQLGWGVVVQEVVLDLEVFSNLEQDCKSDVEGFDGLAGRSWTRIRVRNPGHMHGEGHREIERIEGSFVDNNQPMPASTGQTMFSTTTINTLC